MNKSNPFRDYRFKRLRAERDIQPEEQAISASQLGISANGAGATRTIHHFRSTVGEDHAIVEQRMLNDLNTILGTDAHFTRIDTLGSESKWEIWLDEAHKGRVSLSNSGSGLKTIILVLAYIHLLPLLDGADAARYLYGFEELENNLHPAVLRRLLHFLRSTSERVGCHFFLTSHSPVEIDYFARDENAQVLHVTHDRKNATVTTLSSYGQGRRVLDDLDLRASDILQSNGIIWVEGPSDRIYLNRWIELWTYGQYREGAHYQVLFYGGNLLKHLDADQDPDLATATVHILTTNRHAAILMDSDKSNGDDRINPTKQRVKEEIARAKGLAWITAGREIENYIPPAVLRTVLNLATNPGSYDDVAGAIINDPSIPRRFTDKVTLAQAIIPHLTREHLQSTSDLATQLAGLVENIKHWNGD
jgi:putative ATP-dependent endonuclease of the OLD family